MSKSKFAALDKQAIAVQMEVNGRPVQMRGVAAYDQFPEIGAVLKIHVDDSAGDFDLILCEDGWQGKIEEVHQSGCRFRISLTACDWVTQNS